MERIRFFSHLGQRILLVDSSGCTPEEIASIADQVPDILSREPSGSVLLLADFTNSHITREAMERVKIAAAKNKRHLKRSAWVLTGNLPKPLHNSVQAFSIRNIPTFGTRQEALNYLVAAA